MTPIYRKELTKNITIGGSIKNLRMVSELGKWKRNQNGHFIVSWDILSSDSCVCVDFDHDNKGLRYASSETVNCTECHTFPYKGVIPAVPPLKVPHYFPRNGNFKVVLLAYNDILNATVDVTIPVSDLDCAIPNVAMKNGHYTFATAQKGVRSRVIQIVGEIVALPCKTTPYNDKEWILETLDPASKLPIATVNLSMLTSNDTILQIPSNFLDYGYYRATFTVTMDKNKTITTFSNKTMSYLHVTPSPLVIIFTDGGMSSITKGHKEEICLDIAKYSRDPDIANASDPQVRLRCV